MQCPVKVDLRDGWGHSGAGQGGCTPQKPVVRLGNGDRQQLRSSIQPSLAPGPTLARPRILLKADQELSDEDIADGLEISTDTVSRVRPRF